jgi:hypothetical protein
LLQLLNPIWLFAASAVIIPVAIHLWNIRPGKILKVGSVSLIKTASRKSSRSFKLLDIPLFITRCLLLILIALLLSIPVWQKKLIANKAKGWLLIPKERLEECYKKFKPRIDSLTAAGYEFHYFNKGFTKSDLKQTILHLKDSIPGATNELNINYWTRIRQLGSKVSSTLPVYLITPNQAVYFAGAKPQVALKLDWQTYIPDDSVSTWIENAWFNNNNSIRVLRGDSKPSGTTYTPVTVQSDITSNSPFTISTSNGQPAISIKNSNDPSVNIDTTTVRIAVYTDNNATDAGYLKAALDAASIFIQHKTIIKQYNDPGTIPAGQSWLFWLSEKAVSERILHQCRNVLCYEKGRIINSDSWLNNNSRYALNTEQDKKIDLFKLIEAPDSVSGTIWHDGFGHPVLSLQKQAQNNIYHFYNRFNPAWNDLVWSSAFPSWILELVTGETTKMPDRGKDKRVLNQQQLLPAKTGEHHIITAKIMDNINITNYLWLALMVLFLAERWLAHRSPNLTDNG